jgi:hypothetical protein
MKKMIDEESQFLTEFKNRLDGVLEKVEVVESRVEDLEFDRPVAWPPQRLDGSEDTATKIN